jgi:hypothetical protein
VTAILSAHRQRMGQEPVVKQSLTPDEAPAAIMATNALPDYTSETEDLTTWPETRGPEWRRMDGKERLVIGDVVEYESIGLFQWAGGLEGDLIGRAKAWTRRPKSPRKQGKP